MGNLEHYNQRVSRAVKPPDLHYPRNRVSSKEQVATPYDPATDFYKGIREAIIDAHQLTLGKRHITNTAAAAHANRSSSYITLAGSYNTWWGRKTLTWVTPPRGNWSPPGSTFDVAVNPELGLDINGDKHAIKLYFKAEALSKNRIDIITHLMHASLSPISTISKFSVLDIRRRRLYTVMPPTGLNAILVAEFAYIESLWPTI